MNRIKKNSTIKCGSKIKQNNKIKNKTKMRTKKNYSTLNNKKNESALIELIESLIKSYLKNKVSDLIKKFKSSFKKIVTEICFIGVLASPGNMTDVKEVRTIKFDAEIHISYSILDQNGIGQP